MAVYLLHFSGRLGNTSNPHGAAQHYVGFTNGETVEARLEAHRHGNGARITAAAVRAGLDLELARVWEEGDRDLEHWIKRQKHHKRFCPICGRGSGELGRSSGRTSDPTIRGGD